MPWLVPESWLSAPPLLRHRPDRSVTAMKGTGKACQRASRPVYGPGRGHGLLRGLFGARLSYLRTVLNILQCLGWAVFELVTTATAAHAVAPRLPD
jgi:hypothetical protein